MIYDLRRGLDWIRQRIAETQEVTLLHSLSLSRRFDLHTHSLPSPPLDEHPPGAPPGESAAA